MESEIGQLCRVCGSGTVHQNQEHWQIDDNSFWGGILYNAILLLILGSYIFYTPAKSNDARRVLLGSVSVPLT